MAFGLAGAYTVRASARFSADVTIDMWEPSPHSENRTRGGVAPEIQLSAEVLDSNRLRCPPNTGTTQVDHPIAFAMLPATPYAIRSPAGRNTGLILLVRS